MPNNPGGIAPDNFNLSEDRFMTKRSLILIASILVALLLVPSVSSATSPVDFQLPDVDGNERKLSEFRGKWVVVNYWATWCPPCLDELPELELFHSQHKDKDAVVLGVNFEEIDRELLKDFLEDQFISFPVLLGEPSLYSELGRVPGLPTSYIVSPEGLVVARQVGPVSKAMLESYIENYKKDEKE